MPRLTSLVLLIPLAGCIETSIDRPAESTVETAASVEADRLAERDRALAQVHADEGYRLMNEDRDDAAAEHFFKALELDPDNDRARAGVELIHDRSGSRDFLITYRTMIRLYAQAARDEIDAYLAEATEQLVKTNFQAAREKVAAARLTVDARRTVFGGPEQRALRQRVDEAAKAVDRAQTQYERRLRRIREGEIQQLRTRQIRESGRAWTAYAN